MICHTYPPSNCSLPEAAVEPATMVWRSADPVANYNEDPVFRCQLVSGVMAFNKNR
jgi:hypothetical protein